MELLIGDRVNVSKILTEDWQSEQHIINGVVLRITDNGIPVISIDSDSTYTQGFTGGLLHSLGFLITLTH